MEQEMEIAALGSVGGLTTGDGHPVESGAPCRNCGEIVAARYCSACGQLATDFHRPVWNLILTSLSDTFALDSRLWRTLPLLLFRPGRLTRNYLDGQRMRYVPPFRMFLLSSIVFFLMVFTLGDQLGWYDSLRLTPQIDRDAAFSLPDGEQIRFTTQEDIDRLRDSLTDKDLSEEDRVAMLAQLEEAEHAIVFGDVVKEDGSVDREELRRIVEERSAPGTSPEAFEQTWRAMEHAVDVYEDQDRFMERLMEWAPRFSFLFLPVLALMLSILYAWHRSKFIYDHIVTSLHVQTFIFILGTAFTLLGILAPGLIGWLWLGGFVIVLAYLYRQLRVTYGTGRFMSALRAVIIYLGGMFALSVIAVGLVVAGFMLT